MSLFPLFSPDFRRFVHHRQVPQLLGRPGDRRQGLRGGAKPDCQHEHFSRHARTFPPTPRANAGFRLLERARPGPRRSGPVSGHGLQDHDRSHRGFAGRRPANPAFLCDDRREREDRTLQRDPSPLARQLDPLQSRIDQRQLRRRLRDPHHAGLCFCVSPDAQTQRYIVCDLSRKVELLYSFIKSHLRCKILVFAASRKEVRFLFEAFRRMKPGVSLLHLHGKQKQTMRTYTYYDFIQKDHAVLFCTDVAARGIDFPAVDWVVQFDCPEDAATYIHRVGRAGRFRAKGNGLLFLLPQEEAAFLPMMAEANIPLKRIAVNPSRTQSVTNRLMEEIARDETLGQLASKAFQSYVRSVYLASNKQLFDVRALPLEGFAEVGSPIPRLSVVAGAGRGAEPELLEEEGEEGGVLRAAAAPGGDQEGRGGQGARQRALAGRCERCEGCERGTESGGGDFGRGRLPAEDGEDDGGRARVGGPAAGEEAEEAAADLAGRRADREEHSVRRERRGDRRHARRGGAEGRGGRDRRGGGEGASERRADAAGRERRKGSDARKEASQGEEDAAQAEGEGDA